MKVVWEFESCAARDVYTATAERYGWAIGTAKNLLHRLMQKGHLKYEQIGNSYLYKAVSLPLESLCQAADTLLENAVDDETCPLFLHMIKKGKLTPNDVAELRELLNELDADSESEV